MLALVDGDRRWSAPEVDAWADRLARWLDAQQLGRGDRLGVVAFNLPDTIALWLACRRRAVTLVPFNARLTEVELQPLLALVQARLVLRPPFTFDAQGLEAAAASPARGTDVAALLFTSGTTGQPRPVALRWEQFDASAAASAGNLQASPGDRWLLCLPLFHVGGLSLVHRCAVSGSTVVLERAFDAERINGLIDSGLVTHASLVGTQLTRLLEQRGQRRVPASLRAVLVGGGPVPTPLLERARALGLPVLQTYGLTEACSQVATERLGHADGASCGPPLPGVEVRITRGEIEVRGPTVAAPAGQWLATGDLGELDAHGRLVVHSRRVDLIVTGGENVYPLEVERVLAAWPGVREVAVVPRADATWGQVPVAAIAWAGEPSPAAELDAWCRRSLAGFKVPRAFVPVAELPRNAMGKLDRRSVLQALG